MCLLEQLLFSVVFGQDAHTQRDTIFNHWPPPEESEPLFLRACSENPHGAVCWQSMLRVSVNLLNNNRWKERLWKWLIVFFHMLPILGFVLLVQTDCPMFFHSSLSFLIVSFFLSLLSLCSLLLVIICYSVPSWAREQLNYSTYLMKSIFTLNCNLVTVNEHLVNVQIRTEG